MIFCLYLLRPLFFRISWDVVFIINAGSTDITSSVFPKKIAYFLNKTAYFKGNLFPVSLIFAKNSISLVLSNTATNTEIWENKNLVMKQLNQIKTIKGKRIALGGIYQSILERHDLTSSIDERISLNNYGAIFMLTECIQQAINVNVNLALDKRKISIIGSGYTGQSLAHQLERRDFKINLFDIENKKLKNKSKNIHFLHKRFHEVSNSGLIILLTSYGDNGVVSIEPYLLPNMVLLSDTYPKVTRAKIKILAKNGVKYFECHAKLDSSKLFPSYGYMPSNLLGGCFIQSYVEAVSSAEINSFEQFHYEAKKLGLSGCIIPVTYAGASQ
jgi:hypothetical protein